MIDTVWALILVTAGFNMAFAVRILNTYFASIPAEIEEAAMVATIPVLILFALIERRVVGGLTAGSIRQRAPGSPRPGKG